ncbi:hypothetical protein ABPG77_010572 [Micractinium sp. CCAP 211/92]
MSDDGREREVRDAPMEAAPSSGEGRRESGGAQLKCFVGGIPWSLNDAGLKDAFAEFNPTEAVVMIDRMTQRSRGFGFVMFADKRDQDAAIDRMHNTELDGRRISVTRAVPQSETAPGTPADALRRGQLAPRDGGRYNRGGYGGGYGGGGYGGGYGRSDRGYGGGRDDYYRGGGYGGGRDDYYRGGGGYGGGGYDRGGYGGYDQRGGYGGGYDQRGGYGGYDYGSGGGYGGGSYGGGYGGGGYSGGGYDQRGGYGGGYEERGGGYGADRGHADRRGAGPYDRR